MCRTKEQEEYARKNRKHLSEYAKQRHERIWRVSDEKRGKKAELLASHELLLALGCADVFCASPGQRFAPYDFCDSTRNSCSRHRHNHHVERRSLK